jgi:predicted amidohydrolase YtcJ
MSDSIPAGSRKREMRGEQVREYVVEFGKAIPYEGDPTITTMHVRDGRIVRTGHAELGELAQREGIPLFDRRSSIALPGFIDCHVHFDMYAARRSQKSVDCGFPNCKSLEEILERLSDADQHEGWIIGHGNLFLDQKIADRRLPTKQDLDRVSTQTPIVLHCGGHITVLNTAAVRLIPKYVFDAGLEGLWGSPRVERDDQGELTGRFAEITGHLPIPEPSREEHAAALLAEGRKYLEHGVTTIGEMTESSLSLQLLRELTANDELKLRIRSMLVARAIAPEEEVIAMAAADRDLSAGSARFAISGVKMFADGGYSARNAATITEYLPTEAVRLHDRGRINLSYAELRRLIDLARQKDVQLAIHANGARAQKEVMNAIIDSGDPFLHRRIRIEHLGNFVPDFAMLEDMKRSRAIPVMNPGFLNVFIGDFLPVVLGDVARRGRMPTRTILDDGIVPVFASDGSHVNPLFNCGIASNRMGFWGDEIEPWESISLAEALPLHGIEAAKALSVEGVIGSLTAGKEADFILYEEDPRSYAGDFAALTPQEVYVHGELVHSKR